jgi:hypothetical protein
MANISILDLFNGGGAIVSSGTYRNGIAGEAIQTGDAIREERVNNQSRYFKSSAEDGEPYSHAEVQGFALSNAPVAGMSFKFTYNLTIEDPSDVLADGVLYCLSPSSPGQICPYEDLIALDWMNPLAYRKSGKRVDLVSWYSYLSLVRKGPADASGDLSFDPNDIQWASIVDAQDSNFSVGETLTPGQMVSLDSGGLLVKSSSATPRKNRTVGITVSGGVANSVMAIWNPITVDFGVSIEPGELYCVSDTDGQLKPYGELTSGEWFAPCAWGVGDYQGGNAGTRLFIMPYFKLNVQVP